MVLAYHFERHPRFGPLATRLLEAAENGRVHLVASSLALLELLIGPKRLGREDLAARYREVLGAFPNLDLVPLDVAVAEAGATVRARYGIRTPAAIHVGTALTVAAAVFVSEDRDVRRVREIPVLAIEECLARIDGQLHEAP